MVNMNPVYACVRVFQEVTLSSQPSVGRLILAVLRDITGWLIAVATSLQSQSSTATMWPCWGRWMGVGRTQTHTCMDVHTHTNRFRVHTYIHVLLFLWMHSCYSIWCIWIQWEVELWQTTHTCAHTHILSSVPWSKGFNPAERFQCHLLSLEMSLHQPAVQHTALCKYCFLACYIWSCIDANLCSLSIFFIP